jgi:hypothetical protein
MAAVAVEGGTGKIYNNEFEPGVNCFRNLAGNMPKIFFAVIELFADILTNAYSK